MKLNLGYLPDYKRRLCMIKNLSNFILMSFSYELSVIRG